ncbi:MAG: 50S ribosomal protein L9 [Planctomycetota bacterium]|jgi:large subunit ribosomal protein L9
MELILLESVEGLGRPGDQVKVKPGYARNFLLPTGMAVPLSADALRGIDKLKEKADAEERAMLSSMEQLAQKIAGAEVEISARATNEGHLFGSVTDKDVHSAFAAAGWQLPARAVRLPTHIKESGPADVTLHLYGEITAEVKIEVVPVDAEGVRIELEAGEDTPAEGDAEGEEGAAEGDADAGSEESAEAPAEKPVEPA